MDRTRVDRGALFGRMADPGAALNARFTAIDVRLTAIDGAIAALTLQHQQAQAQMLAALTLQQQQAQAQMLAALTLQQQQAQAQMLAALTQLLGAHGVVGVAQRQAAARRANAAAVGTPFVVVPRDDGAMPPSWPAGLDRVAFRTLPGAAVDLLLADFALAAGGTIDVRRQRLAEHIGAPF